MKTKQARKNIVKTKLPLTQQHIYFKMFNIQTTQAVQSFNISCTKDLWVHPHKPSIRPACSPSGKFTLTDRRPLTACPSEPPSPPDNTTLEGPERDPPYWVGSRVWYKCEEGLATPNGWEAVSLTCSLESEWGQLDIQCEPGECMYSTLNNDTHSHMLTQFCDTLFPFPSMLHLSTALFLSSYNPIHHLLLMYNDLVLLFSSHGMSHSTACPLAPRPYDLTTNNVTSKRHWGITYGYWCKYGFYEETGQTEDRDFLNTTCVEGNWTRTHIPKCIGGFCIRTHALYNIRLVHYIYLL